MRFFDKLFLVFLATSFYLKTDAQKIIISPKEQGKIIKSTRKIDTTFYDVIIQGKDRLSFDINKLSLLKEDGKTLTGKFQIRNKSIEIEFFHEKLFLMSLKLKIIKNLADTVPLYSVYDIHNVVRLEIMNSFICQLESLQVADYDKVQEFIFCRKLLNKLVGCNNYKEEAE